MKSRVLILTEGNCVSVYVDGDVQVQRFDRPVCRGVKAQDYIEEQMEKRIGPYWLEVMERGYHRLTFWCETRSLAKQVNQRNLLDLVREGGAKIFKHGTGKRP